VAQHELAHSRHEASGLAVELEEARHSVAAAQAQASTAFGRIIVLEKALTAAMEVSFVHCNRELLPCLPGQPALGRVGSRGLHCCAAACLPAPPLTLTSPPSPACSRPQDASQLQHVLVEQQSVRMELQQSQADAQQLQVALADSHRDLEHLMVALTRSQEDATSLATQLEEARNEAAEAQTAAASARGRITVLERAWSAALDVSKRCCCCSCCCVCCCGWQQLEPWHACPTHCLPSIPCLIICPGRLPALLPLPCLQDSRQLQDVLGEKEQIESELTQSQAEAEQLQQALAQTQREASTLASQLAEAQRAAAAASFAMQQAADEQERSAHLEQEVRFWMLLPAPVLQPAKCSAAGAIVGPSLTPVPVGLPAAAA
jgi:hypothetical protein